MNNRRHLFLLALAVFVLVGVLHLQGCATDYTWTRQHEAAESVLWRKVSRDEMYRLCNSTRDQAPNRGGCAHWYPKICEVWSMYSEDEAKRTMSGDGLDLYTHEVRHCEGFGHSQHRR